MTTPDSGTKLNKESVIKPNGGMDGVSWATTVSNVNEPIDWVAAIDGVRKMLDRPVPILRRIRVGVEIYGELMEFAVVSQKSSGWNMSAHKPLTSKENALLIMCATRRAGN